MFDFRDHWQICLLLSHHSDKWHGLFFSSLFFFIHFCPPVFVILCFRPVWPNRYSLVLIFLFVFLFVRQHTLLRKLKINASPWRRLWTTVQLCMTMELYTFRKVSSHVSVLWFMECLFFFRCSLIHPENRFVCSPYLTPCFQKCSSSEFNHYNSHHLLRLSFDWGSCNVKLPLSLSLSVSLSLSLTHSLTLSLSLSHSPSLSPSLPPSLSLSLHHLQAFGIVVFFSLCLSGDRIVVLKKRDSGSWYGSCNGREGRFPCTFVEPLPEGWFSLVTTALWWFCVFFVTSCLALEWSYTCRSLWNIFHHVVFSDVI